MQLSFIVNRKFMCQNLSNNAQGGNKQEKLRGARKNREKEMLRNIPDKAKLCVSRRQCASLIVQHKENNQNKPILYKTSKTWKTF